MSAEGKPVLTALFQAPSEVGRAWREGVHEIAEMVCKPRASSPRGHKSTRAGEFRKYPAMGSLRN